MPLLSYGLSVSSWLHYMGPVHRVCLRSMNIGTVRTLIASVFLLADQQVYVCARREGASNTRVMTEKYHLVLCAFRFIDDLILLERWNCACLDLPKLKALK